MGGRRTPRIITRVIVFLLLGAIVNVAVAWGCALIVDPEATDRIERGVNISGKTHWEVFRQRSFGTERVTSLLFLREIAASTATADQILPRWCQSEALGAREQMLPFPPSSGPIFQARGWPFVAISQRFVRSQSDRSTSSSIDLAFPDFAGNPRSPRLLPLRPIWPGFAINTLFYAGMLWLLFAAPFALRRRRRIRRGLCPACAYPVGDSEVCTECGTAVTPRGTSK
jgi:hypothetical protein